MQLIDRDIAKSSALVIDANPTARGLLAAQLRDFGVGAIVQCARIQDARRQLESRTFDIVLCEQEFEAEGYSGQNLLDDLRRMQLLPLSTVFIIVTGGASQTMVADAAESAVDSYLLKPYTASALGERIAQSRRRKKSLAEIFATVERGELANAASLCARRFTERGPYHAYAARLGGELLFRLGDLDGARRLSEQVLALEPSVPWARLGLARAQIGSQQAAAAMRGLESLVADQPKYTDAFDVLGRLQVEQGNLEAAAATCQRAWEFTRGSIARLQRHALLSFYTGRIDEAAKALERASTLGSGSRMFDPQVLLLLAAVRLRQGDAKALQRALGALQNAAAQDAGNARMARLAELSLALGLLSQPAALAEALGRMASLSADVELDGETACHLLTVWSGLAAAGAEMPEAPRWVDRLSMRFASSRALTELMTGAAGAHAPFAAGVQEAHKRVTLLAEQAMGLSHDGRAAEAVRTLLDHAERSLNAKLVDLARLTLQRHRDTVGDATQLSERIERLRTQVMATAAIPALAQASERTTGSLTAGARPPANATPEIAAAGTGARTTT